MTWLRNRWKLKPPVKNGKKGSSLSMEKLLMFTRSMTNCIDEWTEYTLRHERWLWVWKNLMKVLRKHFVRVSYAGTAQMVDIGILVIGILSTLAFLPVAFRVVAYCTLAFCQWVYCLWHYVYWHYSQWRFVLWRFICGVLSRDRTLRSSHDSTTLLIDMLSTCGGHCRPMPRFLKLCVAALKSYRT